MLLDKSVATEAKQPGSEANGVARALTLTALTQLKGEGRGRRNLVFQFLRESNFPILAGTDKKEGANLAFYDLSWADLLGANLSEANLNGANLFMANLIRADLIRTYLGGANLRGANLFLANLFLADLSDANLSEAKLRAASLVAANLSGADLRGANLSEANLLGVQWNEKTKWPEKVAFTGAKNIPPELKKWLGID